MTYEDESAGFRILSPEPWSVEDYVGGAMFIDPDATRTMMVVEAFASLELQDYPQDTPEIFLRTMLMDLNVDIEYVPDEIVPLSFGETPGGLVEVHWTDSERELDMQGYFLSAVGDEVVGLGWAFATTEEWEDHKPTFSRMIDSLEFFPPSGPDAESQGSLEWGEVAQGVLEEGSLDSWTFEGQEGQVVNIQMSGLSEGLDCYLELYSSDDVWLTADDDSGEGYDSLIKDYVVPVDGTYRVVASNVDVEDESGQYEIVVETTELETVATIAYGASVNAMLAEGAHHHWIFNGERGDVVTVTMIAEDPAQLDTMLLLFAPDGRQIAGSDDWGEGTNSQITEVELPLDGRYRIVARGYSGIDTGMYELSLTSP